MKVFVIFKNCGILPVNSYSGHKFLHDRSSLFFQSFYSHFYICLYFFAQIIHGIGNYRFTVIYKDFSQIQVYKYHAQSSDPEIWPSS